MSNQSNKVEFKIGDWVDIKIIGIRDDNDPPYRIESINGDEYTVIQKEGCYIHRIKVTKDKLRKL